MWRRLRLQTILEDLLTTVSDNLTFENAGLPWEYAEMPWEGYDKLVVYFQPPETIKLTYPCIIYSRDSANTIYANNKPYCNTWRYQLMVIDKDPDSVIPKILATLPMCRFNRHYTKNNLNHDVFNIYY